MVSAEYHPETFDTYFAPVNAAYPGFTDTLLADFIRYQESEGEYLPSYFGCDNPYGSPASIANCIEHIHLCIPPRKFPKNALQRDRKCKRGKPHQDVALVYSRGLIDSSQFVIIGLLRPDAHAQAKDMALMQYLGGLGRVFRYNN